MIIQRVNCWWFSAIGQLVLHLRNAMRNSRAQVIRSTINHEATKHFWMWKKAIAGIDWIWNLSILLFVKRLIELGIIIHITSVNSQQFLIFYLLFTFGRDCLLPLSIENMIYEILIEYEFKWAVLLWTRTHIEREMIVNCTYTRRHEMIVFKRKVPRWLD